MKTRTIVAGGVAAITAFLALALVVLDRAPSAGPTVPAPAPLPQDPVTSAEPAVPPLAVPAALPAAGTPEAPSPEITPPQTNGRRSAAAYVEWQRVPIAARVGQLGPDVSGAVVTGLRTARAQMDGCFQDEARLLASGRGPGLDTNDAPGGPGALTLLLQSRPGGVDVVTTEVVYQGTSSPHLVSCVRHVLEGWPIPAPKASGGRRYKLRYTIQ